MTQRGLKTLTSFSNRGISHQHCSPEQREESSSPVESAINEFRKDPVHWTRYGRIATVNVTLHEGRIVVDSAVHLGWKKISAWRRLAPIVRMFRQEARTTNCAVGLSSVS